VKPEGIERVLVNGETIVERGDSPTPPGRVLRVGNPSMKQIFTQTRDAETRDELSIVSAFRSAVKVMMKAAFSIRAPSHRDRAGRRARSRARRGAHQDHGGGLCHSDLSVIDGTIPYPVPVVLGHEGAGVIDAVGVGVRSVKEGDTVIVSTLSHCGRCAKCDAGHPTECKNAPSPKDAKPFTIKGSRPSSSPTPRSSPSTPSCASRARSHRSAGAVRPRGADRLRRHDRLRRGGESRQGRDRRDDGRVRRRRHRPQLRPGRRAQRRLEDHRRRRHAAEARVGAALRRHARHRRSKTDPVAAIKDLTGGGADYSFECVGNVAVIKQALEALGPGGSLTIVGVPKVGTSYDFVVHALYQNKSILGCRYGAARPQRDFPMLADLYLSGRLKIDELITRHYALDDFDHALDDLRAANSRAASSHGLNQDPKTR
jgi:S-(hydroxymethyl)glutathione dehydrogenase/alcohol dehydrogenase